MRVAASHAAPPTLLFLFSLPGSLAPDGSAFYCAWTPFPEQLWAAIRDSSRLYVLVFGDRSWRMAEAFVSRINLLHVVKQLDYCGQDERAESKDV